MPWCMPKQRATTVAVVALAMSTAIGGCASLGPGTIARDRFDYDHAVTMSWKRMMLLNLVKLRYGDVPLFLDVSSIINSYSLEGSVSLGGEVEWGHNPVSSAALGGVGRYSDKPTITYNPLLGERFARSMMTPITPGVVMSLIQSGWSAKVVMQALVSSANGYQNRFGFGDRARGADLEYQQITQILRRNQVAGAVGMRVEKGADSAGAAAAVLTLGRRRMTPELEEDSRALHHLLGIRPEAKEIRVVYGAAPLHDDELALLTRSLLEIMADVAGSVEVPASDVEEGRVLTTAVFDTDTIVGYQPLIRIRSGPDKPDQVFVSVPYGGHWYWIDDRDFQSKSSFSFLMILFSMTETGSARGQPIITIPAF